MATLAKHKNGYFQIQFQDQNRRTQTISLSRKKYSEVMATELHQVVERLIYIRGNGDIILDKKTETWIEEAPSAIQEKLANVDLIKIPERHTALELWNEVFRVKREDEMLSENSLKNYRVAFERFFAFFDGKSLSRI